MSRQPGARRCRCGTRLARDNVDVLCGACRKQARSLADGPPAVPASFWQEPSLRAALGGWHIGRVIAAYRLHPWHGQPLPQQMVAGWLCVSQARLSRIENGEPIQDLAKLVELAQLFEIPPELLWFMLPGGPDRLPGNDAAATGGLDRLIDAAADWSLSFAIRTSELADDDGMLAHLRTELSCVAVDYVHTPVGSIFRNLVRARDAAFQLLEQQRRPTEARELYFLGGTACLLMAHASQNLGNQRAARAQLRTSLTCADAAGRDSLRAWSLGTAALFNEWSTRQTAAVELAVQAEQLDSSRESRIRLAAIEARAAARIGDRQRAHAALGRLQAAQGSAESHDDVTDLGGVLSFPETKQNYYIGSTYGLLGEHDAAERFATAAITAYETGPVIERSYGDEALARLDVTNARLARGDVDGAAEAVSPVLNLPADRQIRQLHLAVTRTAQLLDNHPASQAGTGRELAAALNDFDTGARALPSPQ